MSSFFLDTIRYEWYNHFPHLAVKYIARRDCTRLFGHHIMQSYAIKTISTETLSAFYNIVPKAVRLVADCLHANGFQAFVVGGAVRDFLLGRDIVEYDMATDAEPTMVRKIFKRTAPTGIKHGTVLVIEDDMPIELTTFRSDGNYSDGRRPDEIRFAKTVEEDLSRRDFTVNAFAYDMHTKRLVDLFKGEADLRDGVIRSVGDAYERFQEDGLRIMRACRFAAKLGFEIEAETFAAIADCLSVFAKVSAERVRDELNGILLSDDLFRGIEYMRRSGILPLVLPELADGYGVAQNRYHAYDVYYHNLHSCASVQDTGERHTTLMLRLAALLHDVGKTAVKKKGAKEGAEDVFYNHEVVGAAIARKIMRRLRYSKAEVRYVDTLIRNHMFYYKDEWTDGAVRRFMRKVGLDNIHALLRLREADRLGNGKKKPGESEAIKKLLHRIDAVIEKENALKVTDLAIDGTDLMREFDIKPGRIIGRILTHLLELVLDNPEQNEYERLKAAAQAYLESEEGGR